MIKDKDTLILEPGDTVVCKGIRAVIREIKYQEYWERYGFITEFFDTKGNYRNWKQESDGGYVIEK